MSAVILNEIMKLSEQLTPEERAVLITRLQLQDAATPVTREQLLAVLEQRKAAGAFDNLPTLRGKYANPAVDLGEDQLNATLRDISSEWERELDEFFGDD